MKNKIKELREKQSLSQIDLGKIVGVSRQAIIAVEKGKSDPSIWLAYNLARHFGLTIEELFDFAENKKATSKTF